VSDRALALVLVLVLAPFALVLLAAIVRGYSITLVMEKRWHRRRRDLDDNGA
jgi:hypothetical protein